MSGDRDEPHASASPQPPVLARLASGTAWVALRTPLNALVGFVSVPLIVHSIGPELNGAYKFAWGLGFFQLLLEFGMGSALARRVSENWTRGDRDGVDRAIACGIAFYAVMALVQMAALLGVLHFALPRAQFGPESRELIRKLIWLQVVTAPCFGISMVVSSVLQAARRYDLMPRLDTLVVLARFAILWAGLRAGVDFFLVVAAMIAAQILLTFGPAIRVMVREIGYVPRWTPIAWADFGSLMRVSLYVFLLNLSAILADKLDTTVLGFATSNPDWWNTVYDIVSKPLQTIRQTVWLLTGLLVPAVASLAAAADLRGLDRVRYDASRYLVGLIVPVTLLAAIHAGLFLEVWMGPEYREHAWLMRLYLLAVIPLGLSALVQMVIGMGDVKVIALAALAGSLVNLPLSFALTWRLDNAAGVILGTVFTTLVSNLLIPLIYLRRRVGLDLAEFARRSLRAPFLGSVGLALTAAAFALASETAVGDSRPAKTLALALLVALGCVGYAAGYFAAPEGRADWRLLRERLRRSRAVPAPIPGADPESIAELPPQSPVVAVARAVAAAEIEVEMDETRPRPGIESTPV